MNVSPAPGANGAFWALPGLGAGGAPGSRRGACGAWAAQIRLGSPWNHRWTLYPSGGSVKLA